VIQLHWKDEDLSVRRLVLRGDSHEQFSRNLLPLARRTGLTVADESADPAPGDFWVGCHPERGWRGADPARVGWASLVEVPLAVAALLVHENTEPVFAASAAVERTPPDLDQPVVFRFA